MNNYGYYPRGSFDGRNS